MSFQMNDCESYWKNMHSLMITVQNRYQNRPRMVKKAISKCKRVISIVLQKQSECKIGLFLGKIRSFLMKVRKKNIFWISNVDSRAHSWPCRPVPARFQLTTTYWHKNQSFEHVPTIDLDRSVPISSTIRAACSLCGTAC